MSTPEWKDLERLWQSGGPAVAPALDVIAKQERRRWARRLLLWSEIAITIAGTAVGFWALTWGMPQALFFAGGTLALTWFAAGASWWARSLRRPAPEQSVLGSLDGALHLARVGVRYGLATFWVMVPFLLFLGAVALYAALLKDLPAEKMRAFLAVVGAYCLYGAVCQVIAIVYYVRRARELARLEDLEQSLREN